MTCLPYHTTPAPTRRRPHPQGCRERRPRYSMTVEIRQALLRRGQWTHPIQMKERMEAFPCLRKPSSKSLCQILLGSSSPTHPPAASTAAKAKRTSEDSMRGSLHRTETETDTGREPRDMLPEKRGNMQQKWGRLAVQALPERTMCCEHISGGHGEVLHRWGYWVPCRCSHSEPPVKSVVTRRIRGSAIAS